MANKDIEKKLTPNICQDLIEAVKKGNLTYVKTCVQECPEAIYKGLDKNDSKLLHFVAFYNRTEILEYLLQHGADVHARNIKGFVPLHFSCQQGNLKATEILIKCKANVNIVNIEKSTPLHEAVIKDHLKICDLLLKHGADPNILDIFGKSPVDVAEENSSDNISDLLRKCIGNSKVNDSTHDKQRTSNQSHPGNLSADVPPVLPKKTNNIHKPEPDSLLLQPPGTVSADVPPVLPKKTNNIHKPEPDSTLPQPIIPPRPSKLGKASTGGSQDIPYMDSEDSIITDHSCGQVNNPVPGGQAYEQQISGQHHRYNTTPGGPEYNMPPGDPGYNPPPSDPGYNTSTSDPGYNMPPSDPGCNMPPGDPGCNMQPSDPGYNVPPSGPGYITPLSGHKYNTPLSGYGYNTPPSGHGYDTTPCDPEYNIPPSAFGYKMAPGDPRYIPPDDPGYITPPGGPKYNTLHCALGYNMPPSSLGYNVSPGGPGYNTAPIGHVCYTPPSDPGCYPPPSDPGCYPPPSGPGCYLPHSGPGCYLLPSDPGCYQPPSGPGCYPPPSDQAWYNQLSVGQVYQQQLIVHYPGGQHPCVQYAGSHQPNVQCAGGQSVQPPAEAKNMTFPPAVPPREQRNGKITIDSMNLEILKTFSFKEELKKLGFDIIINEGNKNIYVSKSCKEKVLCYITEQLSSITVKKVDFEDPLCYRLLNTKEGNFNDTVVTYFNVLLQRNDINAYAIVRDDKQVYVYAREVADAIRASSVIGFISVQTFKKVMSPDLSDAITDWTRRKLMQKVAINDIDNTYTYICTGNVLQDLQQHMLKIEILGETVSSFFSTFGKNVIVEQTNKFGIKLTEEKGQLKLQGSSENIAKLKKYLKTQYATGRFTVHVPPVLMNITKACLQMIADENHCCWTAKSTHKQGDDMLDKCKKIATWFFPNILGPVTLVDGDMNQLNVDTHIHLTDNHLKSLHKMKEILFEQDTYAIQDYLVNYGDAKVGTVVTLHKDSNMKPYKSRIIVNQDQATSKKVNEMAHIVQSIITILAETSSTVAMPLSAAECISIDDLAEALIKAVLQIKPVFEIFICCSKEDGQVEIIADVMDNIYQKLCKGCYRQCFSDKVSFSSGNSNIDIDVKSASLVDVKADVIVCSVRQDLNLSISQVASYLLQVAGQTLQEECHSKYPNGINFGEVAITSAGNLKQNGAKFILYCALPKFTSKNSKGYRQVVEKIVMKCLHEAEMRKCESVVFPALGTGKLEYPVRDVACAMFDGVVRVFTTHVKQVTFSVSINTPSIFKVFSAERKRHAENKLYVDDTKQILPSLIGTIHDNYSQMKLNVIQEDDMVLLPSNVVVVHFSDTYDGNSDIKFSSDLPEAALDQLYLPMEICQDNLQSFSITATKCFKYCLDNRISAICLRTSEYPGVPDIEQIYKVSEVMEKLLNNENNCIQEVYIALPTTDQLDRVKLKLLYKEPSSFFSLNSLFRLTDEMKSLQDYKMVWQEITAKDIPVDIVLIGRPGSVGKCEKLMQKCIVEARQKYENKHAESMVLKTGLGKSQNTPCPKPHKEDDAVKPWTDRHIMQKGTVSAVINSGIMAYVFANDNIDKWIKTMKDNFQDVKINFDENCKSFVVSGLFDAILKFEKYLDTSFPNDPDVDNKTKTDDYSTEVLNKDSADSATAVAVGNAYSAIAVAVGNADSATAVAVGNADSATAVAVGNVQTKQELQAKGANKSIPKDLNPVTLMPADKKQIEDVAGKSFLNRNMKEPMKDYNLSIQKTVDKKQIEGVAGTSLSNKQIKEPMPNRKLQLRVINKDIIKCSVDCLIISCNQTFSTNHGIMEAVAAAAGNEFRKACQKEVNRYQLSIADCRPVTAGALSCKKIVLVRGPQNMSNKKQMLWELQNAYSNALKKADELGFRSVAVHAIGQDLWQTNMEDCVKQFISAVEHRKFTLHNLEFVYFVEKQRKFYEMIKLMLIQAGADIDIDGEENYTSPIGKSIPCKVEAKFAKVEDLDVEAAVSTESQNFKGLGKIASTFYQLGNEEYRRAYTALSCRACKVTDVFYTKVTSGGCIKCKFVLHTIVPSRCQKYISDALLYKKNIGITVRNILEQASELHCTSVAIPLIGISDTASETSCCQAMIQGMEAFFQSAKPFPVKHIVFCSTNEVAVKTCQDILDKMI